MYSNRDFNRWRRHPWHGLRPRSEGAPDDVVKVYIEMTPADVVKYELDKASGFLMVDRPQRTTSSPPALYGFIPRTYCAEEVAKRCPHADVADGDPLDICVYSERHITRADIVLNARVVGGIQMIDGGEPGYPDHVISIGPMPMMRAVEKTTSAAGVPCTASLDPLMIDGTGMCGGCRVTVNNEVKFACVDGPFFDSHLVDFDEAVSRSKMYVKEEQKAAECQRSAQQEEAA